MTQQYQLPAHLLNRQSRQIGQTLANNLSKSSPPHLSIEGGRFTLVDAVGNEQPVQTYDPQLGAYIDVNIIDANEHVSKIYWGEGNVYNPNAPTYLPPLCFSDNGIGPSRNSTEPQSPTCAQCPHGVWGSATSRITGKGVKACGDLQKIAFTTAGHSTVFLLRIPPNSLKNMGLYQGTFSGQSFDTSDVMTRISFVPGIQGTLQFQSTVFIDEATTALREQALENKATDNLVGRHDLVHPGAAQLGGTPAAALPPPAAQSSPNPAGFQQPSPTPSGFQHPGAQNVQASPPFVMPRQGFASTAAPSSAAPAGGENATPPVAGSKPRGRPRNQPPAQPAPAPQAAPFPTGPAPNVQNGPGAPFGIVQGVAPHPELAATLAGLGLPQR